MWKLMRRKEDHEAAEMGEEAHSKVSSISPYWI